MSCTNPSSEYEALLYLTARLQRRFPEWEEDDLFELIAEELEAFDGARLREYVPVLVERNVRRRLRTALSRAA